MYSPNYTPSTPRPVKGAIWLINIAAGLIITAASIGILGWVS